MWGNKAGNKREIVSEEDNYTFLGTGAKFTGKATFSGAVRINGTLEGELRADDMVIIGEQAVVKGTITCGMIVCKGRVEATVTATHKIQLLKPAVLIGDVYSPSFSIEEGVVFQGQSHMDMSNMDTSESEDHDASPREQERIDLSPQTESAT
ncbi:MAG: polymer-forming cytoskeletal protein [Nitrospira sp.]|nr:polymer-forming cytoskeletal protein [Nitrospira sp.]MDD9858911.1 polymer-forming cytoskeletal protein [Nitrospira sp.]